MTRSLLNPPFARSRSAGWRKVEVIAQRDLIPAHNVGAASAAYCAVLVSVVELAVRDRDGSAGSSAVNRAMITDI